MMAIKSNRLDAQVLIFPLISFRILFGLMMLFSMIRFWYNGWIESLYISPVFHFTYTGFHWVKPLSSTGMYLVFALLIVAAVCIILGLFYRAATVFFFLAFTYVELIDVTSYLNHYYFISLASFLMIWLPANANYSLDGVINKAIVKTHVPAWMIDILRFQVGVVYFFAGLAKLNADWLIHAEPLATWLPAKSYLPLIGKFMYQKWVAYFFSWFGALYDLLIVFFLLFSKTRMVAFLIVVIFHVATAIFFPGIGMFPYIMIANSFIFFSGRQHQNVLSVLPGFKNNNTEIGPGIAASPVLRARWRDLLLGVYVFIQLIVPLRFLFYPGKLFWNEEGYRFSWRVLLMEKSGAAYFTVKNNDATESYSVNNADFLTPIQEKMMSTQPDLILKYAHYLAAQYKQRGIKNPTVFGEIYVALNGRPATLFIDSTVNLAGEKINWKHHNWVLPY